MTASAAEFIRVNPSHPRSAQLLFALSEEEQNALILSLVKNAAFCDSWEAYFRFFSRARIEVTKDVVDEALQAVGLDPMSARLWISAASSCQGEEEKREIYQLGLTIPLREWDVLYNAYEHFEEGLEKSPALYKNDFVSLLAEETWPERYRMIETEEVGCTVYHQWQSLIQKMEESIRSGQCVLETPVQCRRIDLALRQMCAQLPWMDRCYFQYATFQVKVLKDVESAVSTLERGCRAVPHASFALENMIQVLKGKGIAPPHAPSSFSTLSSIRGAGEAMLTHHDNNMKKDTLKAIRKIGKEAAASGASDWKIYSEWCKLEHVATRDPKMAAKVLENGAICCSSRAEDAILLANEAILYHVTQRNETEARSFTEKLVDLCRKSSNEGRSLEARNTLVKTEQQLGAFSFLGEQRETQGGGGCGGPSPSDSFLDAYRVGTLSPCSPSTARWLSFVRDFKSNWRHEQDVIFDGITPSSRTAIAFTDFAQSTEEELTETPNFTEACWDAWNPHEIGGTPIPEAEDPDEVVGPRSYRGRTTYHLQLDERTARRIKHRQKVQAAKKSDVLATQWESPIGRLVQRLSGIATFTEENKRREKSISFAWFHRVLCVELSVDATGRVIHTP